MGNLYHRKQKMKDGTYRELPTFWLQYRQNGELIRESSGTKKETVARRMLKVREGDIEKGIPVVPKRDKVTFDEAAADVVNDYRANGKKSLDACERRLRKHLLPYFRGRRIGSVTTADVRAYVVKRQADEIVTRKARKKRVGDKWVEIPAVTRLVSAAEINRELALLKRIFTLAEQADKLTRKPHVPMLHERNTRTGFFEAEQLAAVLQHLPEHVRPVIEFGSVTGWRIKSEVLPLQWRQVDMQAGEVRLDPHSTKNDAGRVFPFTADLRRLLEDRQRERERMKNAGHLCPFVFFREGPDGKPRPIVSFTGAWRSACRRAGCPGRIPHDLRRTAVRNLVRAGVPERVAMRLTGHKTPSVFARYDIVSNGDLRDAAARLDGLAADHKSDHTGHAATSSADPARQIS
jgi:integrase